MNALAPPPRRPHGTGTVSYHTASGTYRIRTPGQLGTQHSGFATREAAENALDAAALGVTVPRKRRPRTIPIALLRSTLRYAIEIAESNGLEVENELRRMKGARNR